MIKNVLRLFEVGFILQSLLLVWEGTSFKIAITTPQIGSHLLGKLFVGKALAARGHDVHVIVSDKFPMMDTIRKSGVKPLQYRAPPDAVLIDSEESLKLLTDIVFRGQDVRAWDKLVSEVLHKECEYMLNDTQTVEMIRNYDFDLFIVEPFIVSPCNSIIAAYLGKPFVSLALFYAHLQLRQPALPSFYTILSPPVTVDTVHRHTIRDKLKAALWNVIALNPTLIMPGHKTDLLEKYTSQYQTWSEMMRDSLLFLCEVDHHLGGFTPANPNFINVAGLSAGPAQPLPQEFKKIMDESAEHGAIILTFGASAYYMPEETVRKFLEAFSLINQTVLARFNLPDGLEVPKNVKLVSWMPQNDLLGHSNTRLFITHCGNGGQYEALYHGVPMIGFPLFAEQHENSVRAADRGFGLAMNIVEFSAQELTNNIVEVIYNKKYKDAIAFASSTWQDELNHESPLDRATFWIEHVIKFGGRHLRSPAMNLSVFEFLMLDVLLVVVFFIILISLFFIFSLRWLFKNWLSNAATVRKIKSS